MPRLSVEPPWVFSGIQVQNISSFLTHFPVNTRDLSSNERSEYAILAFNTMINRWSIEPEPWTDRSFRAQRKLENSGLQDRIKRLIDELERQRHGDQSTKVLSHRERDMKSRRPRTETAKERYKWLLGEVEKLKINLEELERTM